MHAYYKGFGPDPHPAHFRIFGVGRDTAWSWTTRMTVCAGFLTSAWHCSLTQEVPSATN